MPPPLRRAALVLVLALACGPFRWPSYGAAAPARPAGILLLGTGTGAVYRSVDGGLGWQPAAAGLPAGGVWAVQADPAGPDAAFASTGSLFHTADGGAHWLPVQGPRAAGPG